MTFSQIFRLEYLGEKYVQGQEFTKEERPEFERLRKIAEIEEEQEYWGKSASAWLGRVLRHGINVRCKRTTLIPSENQASRKNRRYSESEWFIRCMKRGWLVKARLRVHIW